jgi:hypothetical protein
VVVGAGKEEEKEEQQTRIDFDHARFAIIYFVFYLGYPKLSIPNGFTCIFMICQHTAFGRAASRILSSTMSASPLARYESFLISNASTISTIESSLRSLTWFLPGRFRDAELGGCIYLLVLYDMAHALVMTHN